VGRNKNSLTGLSDCLQGRRPGVRSPHRLANRRDLRRVKIFFHDRVLPIPTLSSHRAFCLTRSSSGLCPRWASTVRSTHRKPLKCKGPALLSTGPHRFALTRTTGLEPATTGSTGEYFDARRSALTARKQWTKRGRWTPLVTAQLSTLYSAFERLQTDLLPQSLPGSGNRLPRKNLKVQLRVDTELIPCVYST
jgi:hypothetical protein